MHNRVREARLRRNMTMQELAKASGVSQSFISEIETGKHEPKVRRALRLAKALGTNAEELFPLDQDRRGLPAS